MTLNAPSANNSKIGHSNSWKTIILSSLGMEVDKRRYGREVPAARCHRQSMHDMSSRYAVRSHPRGKEGSVTGWHIGWRGEWMQFIGGEGNDELEEREESAEELVGDLRPEPKGVGDLSKGSESGSGR